MLNVRSSFSRMAQVVSDWLKKLWKRRSTASNEGTLPAVQPSDDPMGVALAWLADAPLFIDSDQVSAFYDAVVRPEGQHGKVTISLERFKGQTTKLEGTASVETSLSSVMKLLFPFDIKAKAKATVGQEFTTNEKKGESIEFYPIDNPQRQLIHLTIHYMAKFRTRIRFVQDPFDKGWCDQDFIDGLPRALVFLNFPPGTEFAPMAAEVDKGEVVTMYKRLGARGSKPRPYPERQSFKGDTEAYDLAWTQYWNWFHDQFNAQRSTEAIEKVVADGGRVQWIDYRVLPLGAMNRPLHLHVRGGGKFDTGTFAYQLVKRGHSHGLRVVGTMKSEPDVNVLAIFEK